MSIYSVPVKIDRKIIPFLAKGSSFKIHLENGQAETALIELSIKDGIDKDMLEAISPIAISFSFVESSEIKDSSSKIISNDDNDGWQKELEQQSENVKPSLPKVQDEYEDIKPRISQNLGNPVQTLFSSEERSTPIVKEAQSRKVEELEDNSEISLLKKQMAMMIKAFEQYQNNSGVSVKQPQNRQSSNPQPKQVIEEGIMNHEELKTLIKESSRNLPEVDPNKRLSKEEAIELEKYRLKKSVYVISTVGQLFIDDVGIAVRSSVATNLTSIPIHKLVRSSDIHRCFANGQIKFVSAEMARRMAEKASGSFEDLSGGLKVHVGEKILDEVSQQPFDVTPGARQDDGDSGDIVDRMSSRDRNRGRDSDVMIADVEETDESSAFVGDDQSELMSLSGNGDREDFGSRRGLEDEGPSAAYKESQRTKMMLKASGSKTWKPVKNLDKSEFGD